MNRMNEELNLIIFRFACEQKVRACSRGGVLNGAHRTHPVFSQSPCADICLSHYDVHTAQHVSGPKHSISHHHCGQTEDSDTDAMISGPETCEPGVEKLEDRKKCKHES